MGEGRPVAILSAAARVSPGDRASVPEMVFDVARRAVEASGLDRRAIELTVSASSDMLDGRSFGFAHALEGLGAWPATLESHVEMDGAWAAHHAWLAIRAGEVGSALVVAWGKATEASLPALFPAQLDPFTLAPLGIDRVAAAALQADAWMARTGATTRDLDAVLDRSAPDDAMIASPLFRRHCAPPADGACALVLAAAARPGSVFIAGADHRIEPGALGARDLASLPSAALAAARARALAGWTAPPDGAALSASFAHQVPMLVEALGLDRRTTLLPRTGLLAADPIMATGLLRIADCVHHLRASPGRALAHAASGPALQQNLVFLLEAA